jgi:hypothetical protein
MPKPLYRAAQFFAALRAHLPTWAGGVGSRLSDNEAALVATILPTAPQQALFARMPPNDRRHALAVLRTLQQAGHDHPALMQAALLHDVAKSLGQPLPHRVLIVLLRAFWPGALRRLAGDSWWRRPFAVHALHPAIGAEWAAAAGCEPLAVDLIARHDMPAGPEEKLLAALQWADDLN